MKKLITVLTSIMLMSTAAFAGSFTIGTKGSLAFLEASGRRDSNDHQRARV